jgi:hypothetical protein
MKPHPELTVRLDLSGESVEASVRQIGWGDAVLSFPVAAAPILLIGQTLLLRFRGPSLPQGALVRAFVRQRAEEEGERVYRVQLEHGDGTAFEAAVNRRAAFRVTPDPVAPIRVILRELEHQRRVGAVLRDLSESGMSVLLAKEDEWVLAAASVIQADFFLPPVPRLLRFEADVRHRRLERTAVHYGMRFNTAAEGFEEARETVATYVAERQRAMLRRLDTGPLDAA